MKKMKKNEGKEKGERKEKGKDLSLRASKARPAMTKS
jgi:hypothetical protein